MFVQLSIIDFLGEPDLFTEAVKAGSVVEDSKKRIIDAVLEYKGDICSLASFLRKEYGTGGWCGPGEPKVFFNSKGFYVGMTFNNRNFYTWEQVAMKILDLIAMNNY